MLEAPSRPSIAKLLTNTPAGAPKGPLSLSLATE